MIIVSPCTLLRLFPFVLTLLHKDIRPSMRRVYAPTKPQNPSRHLRQRLHQRQTERRKPASGTAPLDKNDKKRQNSPLLGGVGGVEIFMRRRPPARLFVPPVPPPPCSQNIFSIKLFYFFERSTASGYRQD